MNSPPNPTVIERDRTTGRILGFFLLISAVLVAVAVDSVRNISRSAADSDWVNHTHAVLLEVNGAFAALQAGNGAALAFLATGDASHKAACREALSELSDHLEVAKALTRREPAQQEPIVRLEALTGPWTEFARKVLLTRPLDQPEAARALMAADGDAVAMGDVQHAVEALNDQEMTLLTERDRASYLQAQSTRWTVWSGVTVDVLLLGGVAWLIRDDLAARRRAAAALREANDRLETKVRERTAELAATNERLTAENLERHWGNQALEHQLRYDQLIINSISDLVLVLTKAMNISRVNPAVVQSTGWERPELINRPLSAIVRLAEPAGSTEPSSADPMARALTDGHDLRGLPATVEDKRGRKIPIRLDLFPLRDRDKVVGGVAILQIIADFPGEKPPL